MPRKSKAITCSMPPELAEQVQQVIKEVVFTPNLGPAGVLVLWDDHTCERRINP